jgi:hypothetical protein
MDVPIRQFREDGVLLMVPRSSDAATRDATIMPRREEYVSHMVQRKQW